MTHGTDYLILPLEMDARRYAREFPGWLAVEARGELLLSRLKGLWRGRT